MTKTHGGKRHNSGRLSNQAKEKSKVLREVTKGKQSILSFDGSVLTTNLYSYV